MNKFLNNKTLKCCYCVLNNQLENRYLCAFRYSQNYVQNMFQARVFQVKNDSPISQISINMTIIAVERLIKS